MHWKRSAALVAGLAIAGVATAVERPPTKPFSSPAPVPDMAAQVFLESHPGERYSCQVTALVDRFGELLDVVPIDCPQPLRNTASDAVRGWGFHPATLDDVAVDGQHTTNFVFVSNTVRAPMKLDQRDRLVRVKPTAVPQWPSVPRVDRAGKQWLEEHWSEGTECVLELEVDKRNGPANVELIDCPPELADPVIAKLKRYGMDVKGAEPGDGTRYRMYLWRGLDD